jgi:lysophospholipase L1-like esterase
MGTNDLEEQASPETIAANAVLLLDALKAHRPDLPIFLCEVFPASASKSRPAASIKAINDLYRKAASSRPQVTLVPTYALFANASGDAKPEEFPDLLHPNKAGYTKWASALTPALKSKGLLK